MAHKNDADLTHLHRFYDTKKSEIYAWTTSDTVYVLVEGVIGLLAVVTNGLVLLILWRCPRLQTVINTYIASLAVADIFMGVLVVPLVVLNQFGHPKSFHACVFAMSLIGVFANVSVLSLACVVVDRFLRCRYPGYYCSLALSACPRFTVAVVWVGSALVALLPLMGWHNDPAGFQLCSYRRVIPLQYTVYVRLFGFILPILLVMLVLHVTMLRGFHKSNLRLQQLHGRGSVTIQGIRQMSKRVEQRLVKSLALIFILFAGCMLPINIISSIRLWCPDVNFNVNGIMFAVVLSHCNAFLNPIVYVMNQEEFKQALTHLLPSCLGEQFRSSRFSISNQPSAGNDSKYSVMAISTKLETDIDFTTSEISVADMTHQDVSSVSDSLAASSGTNPSTSNMFSKFSRMMQRNSMELNLLESKAESGQHDIPPADKLYLKVMIPSQHRPSNTPSPKKVSYANSMPDK